MSVSRQLEMKGPPRLFEDFRLQGSDPAQIREVGVVETAYDSILCADFTYVSTPITSGKILYDVLKATGVKTLEDLRQDKKFFYENVILPNIRNADRVAQYLLQKLGGAIIAPAAFEAKQLGWGQGEYMAMWYDVIEKKATRGAMIDGWPYSNGGAEEYLQALLMQTGRRDRNNIAIIDERADAIGPAQAIHLLGNATEDLLNQNFEPVTTVRVLSRAIQLHRMVADEMAYGVLKDSSGKTSFTYGKNFILEQRDVFNDTLKAIKPALTEGLKLLPKDEIENTNSALMHPSNDHTLVRKEERADLGQTPAQILSDDQTPAPKKKRGPKPSLS